MVLDRFSVFLEVLLDFLVNFQLLFSQALHTRQIVILFLILPWLESGLCILFLRYELWLRQVLLLVLGGRKHLLHHLLLDLLLLLHILINQVLLRLCSVQGPVGLALGLLLKLLFFALLSQRIVVINLAVF